MEKEKELHEGEWWNTCPYRNERPGCRHCEITRNIVAEATRRGIQQGKREAWIELTEFCRQEKDRLFPHSPIQLVWTSIANEMSRIADSLK